MNIRKYAAIFAAATALPLAAACAPHDAPQPKTPAQPAPKVETPPPAPEKPAPDENVIPALAMQCFGGPKGDSEVLVTNVAAFRAEAKGISARIPTDGAPVEISGQQCEFDAVNAVVDPATGKAKITPAPENRLVLECQTVDMTPVQGGLQVISIPDSKSGEKGAKLLVDAQGEPVGGIALGTICAVTSDTSVLEKSATPSAKSPAPARMMTR